MSIQTPALPGLLPGNREALEMPRDRGRSPAENWKQTLNLQIQVGAPPRRRRAHSLPRRSGVSAERNWNTRCQKTSTTGEVSLESDFPNALELQIILSVWKAWSSVTNSLETFFFQEQTRTTWSSPAGRRDAVGGGVKPPRSRGLGVAFRGVITIYGGGGGKGVSSVLLKWVCQQTENF